MPITQPPIEAPWARSVSWFAPWAWKRQWKIISGMLLLALVAYPLSFGPVLYLMETRQIPAQTFRNVYGPLVWSACRKDGTRRALEWYGNRFLPIPRRIVISNDGDLLLINSLALGDDVVPNELSCHSQRMVSQPLDLPTRAPVHHRGVFVATNNHLNLGSGTGISFPAMRDPPTRHSSGSPNSSSF